MTRVFISHSMKHDAGSGAVIQRLLRDFDKKDIELVWDRDLLQVGDDWNDTLLTEMETCDGAIILLGASALQRSYVVLECTLLARRKWYSKKWGGNLFELLVVLVGGVKPEDLSDPAKSKLKDIQLGDYQAGTDDNLDVLVGALKPSLERLKLVFGGSGPRRQLLNDITNQILSGKQGSAAKLGGLLKIALPPWINSRSQELRAWATATEMPDKTLRSIGRALAEASDEINEDSALAIVERLAPFSVPGDAAAQVLKIAADTTKPRCFQIHARELDTGRWYARLAYGRMLKSELTQVTNANSGLGAANLFTEIVNCIQESTFAQTIDEAKEQLEEMGAPFFVLVKATQPLTDVVSQVYADFPTVTLVFLTGPKPSAAQPVMNLVTVLEPLLEDETVVQTNYTNTKSEIRRAHAK